VQAASRKATTQPSEILIRFAAACKEVWFMFRVLESEFVLPEP
jgi:hypothetical protein